MRLALPPSWYPGPAIRFVAKRSGSSRNIPPLIPLLSISHRLVRFRCSLLVPSLLRSRRRRLHRYSLPPLTLERLNVGSVRERLLEVADAAGNVFVSLHRERNHGLWRGAAGLVLRLTAVPGRVVDDGPGTEWEVGSGDWGVIRALDLQ
jgi:hypothetical protein